MLTDMDTLRIRQDGSVLYVRLDAPPINMLGPELVRDLVTLMQGLEASTSVGVVVFESANPDFFISHVDVTKVPEYRKEAERMTGEASIGMLFRRLSEAKYVTIAQIEGRARGAGSEFALACDMRFAAIGAATFAQFESSFGLSPGAGGIQHLVRQLGRGRALEVLLGADDYSALEAQQYGWINRALPAEELHPFVASLAERIASFPPGGIESIKERVNAVALASADDFRTDSALFGTAVGNPEVRRRMKLALARGFQTREPELELGQFVAKLAS